MIRFRTLVSSCAALAAALAPPVHAQRTPAPAPHAPAASRTAVRIPVLYPRYSPRVTAATDTSGLFFRLDAVSTPGAGARTAVAAGRPLTAAESQRLLARLQPLRAQATPADSFYFPAETLAPPRAGRTIAEPFPPRDSLAPPPARPVTTVPAAPALEVIRRAPEGEVDLGAEVTVTFSQPMVALSSVGNVAAQAVPVRLTPQPAGAWRWIDARTVKFEPAGRLPMATVFTVEVPAGTRSATGAALAEPLRWSFSTPAAGATGAAPQSVTGLDPILVVAFNQRIDPAAVLRSVRMTADGVAVPVRLADAREVEADSTARALTAFQDTGRWMALRAARPLPRAAAVHVALLAGTPSAEGPRATQVEQYFDFHTYGPLRVERHSCSCRPGDPLLVELSNPVDARAFRAGLVHVEPAIGQLLTWVSGTELLVSGDTRPFTRYTVRLDPSLRDAFGQTLGSTPPITFEVGLPYAELSGPAAMTVLDPLAERAVTVQSVGHARLRLRIIRAQPEMWPAFADRRWTEREGAALPGRVVVDRVLAVDGPLSEPREVKIDLTPALANGIGNAIVAVEAMDGATPEERRQAVYGWVQATRIGIAAFADRDSLLAWTTSLVDGAPIAGAEVRLVSARPAAGTTDARGTATLALPEPPASPILVARSGGDVAFLAPGIGGYATWTRQRSAPAAAWYAFTDRNLYRPGETVRFKGWVRQLAPGKSGGVGLLPPGAGDSVGWTAYDARRNEVARGRAPLTALGGFDASFAVPAGANLGTSAVELILPHAGAGINAPAYELSYEVQEFRRPEYAVSVEAGEGPHLVGESAEVTARASYFAGGALPAAPVRWQVTAAPGSYAPPGWDEWRFGDQPEWFVRSGMPGGSVSEHDLNGATDANGEQVVRIGFDRAVPPRPYVVTAAATVTDVNRQTWTSSTALLVHPASIYVGVRTRRAWLQAGDSIDLDLVAVDLDGKPAAGRTIAVSALRRDWRQVAGEWTEVVEDSASCVRESAPQPVRCVFRAPEGGTYQVRATVRDPQGRTNLTTLTVWVSGGRGLAGPGQGTERSVELVPDRRTYAVGDTARILLRTQFSPSRGLLTIRRNGLAASREVEVSGPTATFSVPITEADVPNVWVQVDLVGAADGRHGEGARGVLYATGTVSLSVPPVTRALAVRALPRDTATAPDARTAVGVEVRDAAGRPVPNAEVALVVVDEAVLALTGYEPADPLAAFYRDREPGVADLHLREVVRVVEPDFAPEAGTLVGRVVDARNGGYLGGARVAVEGTTLAAATDDAGRFRIAGIGAGTKTVVASMAGYAGARTTVTVGSDPPAPLRIALVPTALARIFPVEPNGLVLMQEARAPSAAMSRMVADEVSAPPPPPPPPVPGGQPQIAVRTNFDPLALFAPVVRTDAEGRAEVPFTLPSNLTRYRVWAVAVDGGTRYGKGEAAIVARQPLMVRPSAPRFLNWGDRFVLPVVIQNQTGAPLEVDVAGRASGLELTDPGRRITVPAHDRVEVRLAASAARAGEATVQVAAASPAFSDAAEITLPVYTPATAEAFATYGTFAGDSAVTLPLSVPGEATPDFGGVEVTASSTALQELTDALIYLAHYPYECAEQIASRMLGVTALRDVLYAFRTQELPAPDSLAATVRGDVAALAARQNGDGGFGLWKPGDPSFPYASIHAAHALQRAREKGYAVPQPVIDRSLRYLRDVPRNAPAWYPADVKRALHAYALYVRARLGDVKAGEIRAYLSSVPRDSLTLEEAGWIVSASANDPALADVRADLLRTIGNRATETASTATFATRYSEGEYLLLHSDRRTDGVVLEALLAAQPQNPLVPKVVRGLLGHRVRGRWDNTQENAWVLLALDRYFHAFEGQTPEFVARVWLGDRYAGSHAFTGRQADRWLVSVPMRTLQAEHPGSLTVGKTGPGRIYYRAGLRYAPRNLDLQPLDAGFAVSRTYEAVDDPRDVQVDADGRWHVRAGARVRVTVTMTAPSRRLHVALVDPLPAGFEPVNPELQGAQPAPPAAATGPQPLGYEWWWRRYWYEHQNLRDERAEAFTSLLRAGTYTWSYLARATTPGHFVVPPPHAEEMYSPETFGRGKTGRVDVEAADEP